MSDLAFRATIGRLVGLGTVLTFVIFQCITIKARSSQGLYDLVFQINSCIILFNFLVTISRWIDYEPIQGVKDDDRLPTISVIIPAYNESAFVRNSIGSVVSSDYPKDKVHIIVVDDGSKDDTWTHIEYAARQALKSEPAIQCTTVRHEVNCGKRQAMITAFRAASNEVIVTLDSDTLLQKQALRNLVSPFVVDSEIGGVTGHLSVFNVQAKGWRKYIPRTLDCLFEQNGNIPRAAQSKYGFINVLPGAISAFRRHATLAHTEDLVDIKFLGQPLRHGEDVQLTMCLLRDGWRLGYQSNAVVYTIVPETFWKAFLMYVRWERSNYTYWILGLVQLAANDAKRLVTQKYRHAFGAFSHFESPLDLEIQIKLKRNNRQPDYHPILMIACTPIANLSCLGTAISWFSGTHHHPWVTAMNVCCLVVFATWSSTLLLADAQGENEDNMAQHQSQDPSPDANSNKTYSRLRTKIQYCCLSTIANFLFVSWASVFGLLTLKSQSWLTR